MYGKETRGQRSVKHYLFYPLYSRQVDKESDLHVINVLWPLFHYTSSPNVNSVRVLLYPLFYYLHSFFIVIMIMIIINTLFLIEGRYWHSKTLHRDFRIILPLYFSFTDKRVRNNPMPVTSSVTSIQVNDHRDTESINELEAMGEIQMEKEEEPEVVGDAVAIGETRKEEKMETEVISKFTLLLPFFIRRVTPERGIILGSLLLLLPPFYIKKWDPVSGDYSTNISFFHSFILSILL